MKNKTKHGCGKDIGKIYCGDFIGKHGCGKDIGGIYCGDFVGKEIYNDLGHELGKFYYYEDCQKKNETSNQSHDSSARLEQGSHGIKKETRVVGSNPTRDKSEQNSSVGQSLRVAGSNPASVSDLNLQEIKNDNK